MINILILLAVIAGIVILQVYLSKKDSKWPGLILPVIMLIFSLVVVVGMVAFEGVNTFSQSEYIDGEWVVVFEETHREPISGAVGAAVYIFLIMNIPTAVLLAIYASYRGKQSKQRALEKMSIQDLE